MDRVLDEHGPDDQLAEAFAPHDVDRFGALCFRVPCRGVEFEFAIFFPKVKV